ncbi:pheromone A receptor-domain-containing protein [Amanita rubescens]|nr:pheromone A receptor-domain-containing protein [Amanita rubescens]
MQFELISFPFLCFVFLVAANLNRRVRKDLALSLVIAWLAICNLIQGINAVIWAGNSQLRAPVWCDIVTKLVLGAMIALSASCLCTMRKLELLASSRPLRLESRHRTKWVVIEVIACVVVPVLYMATHLLFQNHRFDILQHYGCAASVYPATISLVFMWLPPLVCCVLSFVLCGIIVHHSYQNTPSQFSQHIYARTSRKAGYFIRRLSVTILTSMVLFIIISFSMIAGDTNAKMSWPLIHADFSIVHVVTSNNENPSIRSIWWGLRFISLVYILLAVTSGEVRDGTKGIPVWRSERSSNDVPRHRFASSRSSMPTIPPTVPRPRSVSLDMRSGWDDMWETKSSLRTLFLSDSSRAKSPTSPTLSPSPTRMDDAFLASALNHVGPSMTAYSSGFNAPVIPAPPVHRPPRRVPSQSLPVQRLPSPTMVVSPRTSKISSVFDAHWPQPPESPVSSTPCPSRAVSPYTAADCPEHVEDDTMSITAHEVSVQHAAMFTVPSSPPREEFINRAQSLKGSWNPDDFSYQESHLYEATVLETV